MKSHPDEGWFFFWSKTKTINVGGIMTQVEDGIIRRAEEQGDTVLGALLENYRQQASEENQEPEYIGVNNTYDPYAGNPRKSKKAFF